MSAGPYILMTLVALGAVSGMISQLGIWNVAQVAPNIGISQEQINSTQQGISSRDISITTPWVTLLETMKMVFVGIITALISIPWMFYSLGFPVNALTVILIQPIQTVAQVIMFFWLFELWTGRQVSY